MKYMITILLGFSTLFCSSNHPDDISGIYKSPKNSKSNQLIFGIFVTQLELNKKREFHLIKRLIYVPFFHKLVEESQHKLMSFFSYFFTFIRIHQIF